MCQHVLNVKGSKIRNVMSLLMNISLQNSYTEVLACYFRGMAFTWNPWLLRWGMQENLLSKTPFMEILGVWQCVLIKRCAVTGWRRRSAWCFCQLGRQWGMLGCWMIHHLHDFIKERVHCCREKAKPMKHNRCVRVRMHKELNGGKFSLSLMGAEDRLTGISTAYYWAAVSGMILIDVLISAFMSQMLNKKQ